MWNRGNLVEKFAELKIRVSRGQNLSYEIRNAMIIGVTIKLMFELNIFETIIATILVLCAFYVVGNFDLNKLRLYQKEAELTTSKYNPHLNKLSGLSEKFK
jgi:hypothetical protein